MVIGIGLAISGMLAHGLFEVLQGNTPTGGLFISAIGEEQRMWVHGTEGAFTLIPNFLLTGLAAMSVSAAIIIWSVGYVHRELGALVFGMLFVLLFLVGGGVAQVAGFLPAWAVATRINKPLTWWRKALPTGLRRFLARLWPWLLAVATTLLAMGLLISVRGFLPGVSDPDTILYIDWALVGGALLLYVLAYVAGFAHDVESRPQGMDDGTQI